MPYVLFIDGKMYGFHLGTIWSEAKAIVEQKAPYYKDAILELRLGGKVAATFYDGRWTGFKA